MNTLQAVIFEILVLMAYVVNDNGLPRYDRLLLDVILHSVHEFIFVAFRKYIVTVNVTYNSIV
jgi:hypothetical protein